MHFSNAYVAVFNQSIEITAYVNYFGDRKTEAEGRVLIECMITPSSILNFRYISA